MKISMDCFVRKYQPELFDLWKQGKDLAPHPEDDQSKLYPRVPYRGKSKIMRDREKDEGKGYV